MMNSNKFEDVATDNYQIMKISGVECLVKKLKNDTYMIDIQDFEIFSNVNIDNIKDLTKHIKDKIKYYKLMANKL